MARGGPGSVEKLKLPFNWPRTADALVWSWHECPAHPAAWWVVGRASDLDTARRDARMRLLNALNGTYGNARLGASPMQPHPDARFVATTRHGDPQTEWEALHANT